MKRTERHRLKENAVMLSVQRARDAFERNRRPITAALVAAAVIIVAVVGYIAWRGRAEAQSRVMLADAMNVMQASVVSPAPPPAPGTPATPADAPGPPPPGSFPTERAKLEAVLPKLKAAADTYPATKAGIAARYHEAATLFALGRAAEAIQQYQNVIDRAGDSLYGNMARLGKADTEAAMGQYDAAISDYQELAKMTDSSMPVDGVLMQLARTYQMAGKKTEAAQTFRRIVDEYPQSPYAADARKALGTDKPAGA